MCACVVCISKESENTEKQTLIAPDQIHIHTNIRNKKQHAFIASVFSLCLRGCIFYFQSYRHVVLLSLAVKSYTRIDFENYPV